MNKNAIVATLVVIVTIGLGILIAFTGSPKEGVKSSGTEESGVVREDAFFKGAKEAKIEIVEFADYQCPACKLSVAEMKKVMDAYGDMVIFYYRHFPLPQHKLAKDAAYASEAAGLQGKFWEMHDLIFANQDALTEESFKKFAFELGLDTDKFETDMKSKDIESKVQKDLEDAKKAGVNSTPTFFLNGEKIRDGGLYFEEWRKEIEKRL